VQADPPSFLGVCPVTVTFTGIISVDSGPVTVHYTWLRSDGAVDANAHSVTFPDAGAQSQTVSTTWTLGADGFQYSGWEAIEITSPTTVTSSHADFTVSCVVQPP